MPRIHRAFARRKKLILVLIFFAVVFAWARFKKFCAEELGSCESHVVTAYFMDLLIGVAPVLLLVLVALIFLIIRVRNRKTESVEGRDDFYGNPVGFHGKEVEVSGKIECVLKDDFSEIVKRKATDLIRSMTGNEDTRGRYVHQRFLMSGSKFKKGSSLLVLHNTTFGKLSLKAGQNVTVKGEYIHQPALIPGFFGRKPTFYGRIHYTHEPVGFVKIG